MNLLDKLERSKFGRFGIPNLMRYVIIVCGVGAVLGIINPLFYVQYLSLDIEAILHGQVWRIFTFVICPSEMVGDNPFINLLWFGIWAFVYYSIGSNLERIWGTFRFNLFYFGGLLWVIVMTFVFYFLLCMGWMPNFAPAFWDYSYSSNVMEYLNQTLFIAFAFTLPNAQILFYFVIPVRAKWFSIIYLVMDGYVFVKCLMSGLYYSAALIVVLLLNFFLFYMMGRGSFSPKQAYQQRKRKVEYKKKAAPRQRGPRHRCAICGRTEEDAPEMEFRFCSKCEGNYEYCSEHLFTHEHVHHD